MLRARFQDAQFFYQEDLGSSLEQFRPALGGMMFHAELGELAFCDRIPWVQDLGFSIRYYGTAYCMPLLKGPTKAPAAGRPSLHRRTSFGCG